MTPPELRGAVSSRHLWHLVNDTIVKMTAKLVARVRTRPRAEPNALEARRFVDSQHQADQLCQPHFISDRSRGPGGGRASNANLTKILR